jgi:hypothetical protein
MAVGAEGGTAGALRQRVALNRAVLLYNTVRLNSSGVYLKHIRS